MREEEAYPDQEEECRGDAARVEFPPAEGGEAWIGVAEEFEIPGEVVARHGNEGDAAQHVDGNDASGLLGAFDGLDRLGKAHGLADLVSTVF